MKTILITGATSFIGLNLINYLLNDYKVIAVVRPNSEKISLLPESKNLVVLGLEMKDYYRLPSLIKEPIYAMVHLSWGVHVESIETILNYKNRISNILFLLYIVLQN